jgi:hypothetical protein
VFGARRGMTVGLVVLGVAIVGLIVAIAIVASSGAGSSHAATTTTTVPATTTTAAISADPQGSAVALYNAWKTGDRVAASRVASPQAVTQMFSVPYQAQASTSGPVDPYSFQGCQGAAGSTICSWQAQGLSTITMRVRNTTGGLPVLVVDIQRSP